MDQVEKLLEEAERAINGMMDCGTPEFAALSPLHKAVTLLAQTVTHIEAKAGRAVADERAAGPSEP